MNIYIDSYDFNDKDHSTWDTDYIKVPKGFPFVQTAWWSKKFNLFINARVSCAVYVQLWL